MERKVTKIALKDIKTHPVGDMLAGGDAMKPYIAHYTAMITGQDSNKTLEEIAALPEDKRYVFRVLQSLDWALADYDSETVKLDMPYIPKLDEIKERLQLRLWQMRDLLAVLEGAE
jgi:hypothetical protein